MLLLQPRISWNFRQHRVLIESERYYSAECPNRTIVILIITVSGNLYVTL